MESQVVFWEVEGEPTRGARPTVAKTHSFEMGQVLPHIPPSPAAPLPGAHGGGMAQEKEENMALQAPCLCQGNAPPSAL